MRQFFLFFIAVAIVSFTVSAQKKHKDSLLNEAYHSVDYFFESMNARDTASLRKLFYPGSTMMTVYADKNGDSQMHTGTVNEFLSQITELAEMDWKEEVDDIKIKRDGYLAQVWMDFTFWLNGKISHCGVNTMQLYYDGYNWRVLHIADTRRDEGCD